MHYYYVYHGGVPAFLLDKRRCFVSEREVNYVSLFEGEWKVRQSDFTFVEVEDLDVGT